ncbi:MAG: DUF6046 domain-containing protein [Bacteroidales bacterium]|jgi:hypothetical protein|nr:DUF6046 domain-containing protein [Bacteroidales bacterium]
MSINIKIPKKAYNFIDKNFVDKINISDKVKRESYGLAFGSDPVGTAIDLMILKTSDNRKFIFFEGARVDVTKRSSITETSITGKSSKVTGTIKEYINDTDYDVNVSCNIITGYMGDKLAKAAIGSIAAISNFSIAEKVEGRLHNIVKDKPPYMEIKLLNDVLSSSDSIFVYHAYLNGVFGINKLAFKSCSFNQSGLRQLNVMPLNISFVSDRDYEFLVSEF